MTDFPSSSEPRAIAAAPPPNRRRRLWLIAGIVGLLFATIFAVIVYSDAPEPDTSDLAPRRIALADEENFYVQLCRLAKSLGPDGIVPGSEPDDLPAGDPARMPAWTNSSEYDDFADFLAAGHGWTPSRLAKWDAPLAKFANACETLLRLEKSQAPLPSLDDEFWRITPQLSAAAGLYWQAGDRPGSRNPWRALPLRRAHPALLRLAKRDPPARFTTATRRPARLAALCPRRSRLGGRRVRGLARLPRT